MALDWSLVLNILLLIGVILTMGRMIKAKRTDLWEKKTQPLIGSVDASHDDIIAVRKVVCEPEKNKAAISKSSHAGSFQTGKTIKSQPLSTTPPTTVMMFLLAKENQQFAGYELLQTVLASGLRFGEGHLFHRHQHSNGQGPILCSLAAATSSGIFDLQNIGAFSVRGLCLFMEASGNSAIDGERFAIMLDTAHQLRDGLDAKILDDERRPFSDESLQRYHKCLGLDEEN